VPGTHRVARAASRGHTRNAAIPVPGDRVPGPQAPARGQIT